MLQSLQCEEGYDPRPPVASTHIVIPLITTLDTRDAELVSRLVKNGDGDANTSWLVYTQIFAFACSPGKCHALQ